MISGNLNLGIWIFGPGAQNIRVQGNKVGTNIDGTLALPNGAAGTGPGVLIENASGVLIGGPEESSRNVISGNTGDGIKEQQPLLVRR